MLRGLCVRRHCRYDSLQRKLSDFLVKFIMRRILAKGENDLIWEIMADLANRQLGGHQVVAIHLERRDYNKCIRSPH